jgi:hypothetical protein
MFRNPTLFIAAITVPLTVSLGASAGAAFESDLDDLYRAGVAQGRNGGEGGVVRSSPGQADMEPAPEARPVLSPRQARIAEIATRRGDRDFLMVDKALGKIIVFTAGKPVLSGPALTGASPADRFQPSILAKRDSAHFSTDEKVTPAGRFTVTRTYDDELGTAFEINEVHGNGWWLAIHHVWLGIPSEHRQERLQSGNPQEEHVTFGCINIGLEAIRYLTAHLPKNGKTPLYILPSTETLTSVFPESENPATGKRDATNLGKVNRDAANQDAANRGAPNLVAGNRSNGSPDIGNTN